MKKIEVIKMDTITRLDCYQEELKHCTKESRIQSLNTMIEVCNKILTNIELIINK
jgi:hypothetical protein